ncbi:MAG: SpoIID/LytB domain-containing protein [Defluviitaleaceae bacterium]|nr:SpoIID/LytB domain-containing protein [Defluviitaleaceae bacterium]MCL2240835.1 SpoIID/LytB domain-containing protein [Defluviitaleaceae bacterium]
MRKYILFFCLLLAFAGGFTFTVHASAANQEMPPLVRIGLIREFANRESISIPTARIQVGHEENGVFIPLQLLESAVGFVARVNAEGQVTLHAGNQLAFTFTRQCSEPQIREAGGGVIGLGTSTYRGIIALRPANRLLTAINIICPEEYLFGVIPAEMPPNWHMQALMAQAVASRSYLFSRSLEGPHAHQGFNLCDTTCCQVYRGAGHEHANTTHAVNATRGVMVFHEGRVISAVYFSSSGGATDNSENAWVEARPYLRSVNEIGEHNPFQWTRTFTWAELTTLLQAANVNIGTATGVAATQIAASGWIRELTIFGTAGQHRLTGEGINGFFSPSAGGRLASRNFHILEAMPQLPTVWVYDGRQIVSAPLSAFQGLDAHESPTAMHMAYVYDGTTTRRIHATPQQATGGAGVTFAGSGRGHGVGMSQHGAEGMARLGFTYRQILMHYYTGVEVR